MARTPTDADIAEFAPSEVVEKNLAEMKPAIDAANMANAIVADAEDAYKIVGHIEAAEFMLTVSEKMIAESAIKIKKGKLFKLFMITDDSGNCRHVSNFEEFCHYKLKKSRQRVEELVRNYNLLGPELYEKAEKLGFGQRDYNALKALPEDDRKLITQAMEEENFQKALDLMSLMAAKHQEEKQSTKAETDELKKSVTSLNAVIDKKDGKLNDLELQLERLRLDRPQGAHVNWPEAFRNGYFQQLAITRKNLKHAIGSLDLIREDAMKLSAGSEEEEAALTQAREILAAELVGIHNECADMLEALGMSFDRTLGGYCDARIRWLAQP
jgi:hypothetical protein